MFEPVLFYKKFVCVMSSMVGLGLFAAAPYAYAAANEDSVEVKLKVVATCKVVDEDLTQVLDPTNASVTFWVNPNCKFVYVQSPTPKRTPWVTETTSNDTFDYPAIIEGTKFTHKKVDAHACVDFALRVVIKGSSSTSGSEKVGRLYPDGIVNNQCPTK